MQGYELTLLVPQDKYVDYSRIPAARLADRLALHTMFGNWKWKSLQIAFPGVKVRHMLTRCTYLCTCMYMICCQSLAIMTLSLSLSPTEHALSMTLPLKAAFLFLSLFPLCISVLAASHGDLLSSTPDAPHHWPLQGPGQELRYVQRHQRGQVRGPDRIRQHLFGRVH